MKINRLLNTNFKNNHVVTKITDNSNDCILNSIFIVNDKNIKYLDFAIKNGAKTFISENKLDLNCSFNNYIVKNVTKFQAQLLKKFYLKKLNKYKVIGITGTNGKTTTSTLIYQYLRNLNYDALLISSNGIYLDDLRFETNNTTPSIFKIYEFLDKNLKKNKFKKIKNSIHYLIIECSSQGIRNLRVKYIPFDIVLFTNITTDHMDFHKNYSDYFYSKCLLLNNVKSSGLVLTNSDQTNYRLISDISNNEIKTYGQNGDISYQTIKTNLKETIFKIVDNDKNIILRSNLLGDYQIENIVAAYSVLNNLNVNLNEFSNFIENVKPIPGRTNLYEIKNKNIIIDYAHTFPATKRIIDFIKKNITSNLWIVFGCGGERDKTKRSLIGEYICSNALFAVITEDNNRGEDFYSIVNDIVKNIETTNYKIVPSRFSAIQYALENSHDNDYILLLGKGIEKTTIFNEQYNDLEMIEAILND